MRVGVVVVSLVLVGACDSSLSLYIVPAEPHAWTLGVGLVEPYAFDEDTGEQCDYVPCPHDPTPRHFAVNVISGAGVKLDAFSDHRDGTGSFAVEGIGEGSATIAITGDGIDEYRFGVETAPIASSSLVARRIVPETGVSAMVDLGDVIGPLAALAGSEIEVAASYSDGRSPLIGFAPFSVTASGTDVALVNSKCLGESCVFATGTALGSASITTSAGGSVDLDVVDTSAIADFSLLPSDPVVLHWMGDGVVLPILPVTGDHRPILGNGIPIQVTVEDPFIVAAGPNGPDRRVPTLSIGPKELGSTTIDLTWGQVHHQIAVTVTH